MRMVWCCGEYVLWSDGFASGLVVDSLASLRDGGIQPQRLVSGPCVKEARYHEGVSFRLQASSQVNHVRVMFGIERIRLGRVELVHLRLQALVRMRLAQHFEEECGEDAGCGVEAGDDGETTIRYGLAERGTSIFGKILCSLQRDNQRLVSRSKETRDWGPTR